MRKASGKTTWTIGLQPREAERFGGLGVALGIASMPERKISTLNEPAKQISDRQAQVKPLIKGRAMPRLFFVPGKQRAQPEIEEIHLHERRRVAEQLDIAGDDPATQPRRAICPQAPTIPTSTEPTMVTPDKQQR